MKRQFESLSDIIWRRFNSIILCNVPAFGGGGYQFDPISQKLADGGGGIEFRFSPNAGIFIDARYVFADKTDDFGIGRLGFRFSF
jgi:hypothetical protein